MFTTFGLPLAAFLLGAADLPAKNNLGLTGLVYEVEDWTTPRDAWLVNASAPDKWRLWTTEGPGKRSGDASLVSPVIQRDRDRPEDGAPPLHTHITGIPAGVYRVWLGRTTRPLAYSLDGGQTWRKSQTGETELGIREIADGTFDLCVDDRYANPGNIGSTYYDYVRLAPYTPPQLSEVAAFTLPDGTTQISWISSEPAPAAVVECAGREFPETESDLRNHRVMLGGLEPGKTYTARVRVATASSAPVSFVAGQKPRGASSPSRTVELTISEPTEQPRRNWPVTSGVPFAQGTLADARQARLVDKAGRTLPAQLETLASWPDGSVKWLLVSFCTNTARTPGQVRLVIGDGPKSAATERVSVQESPDGVRLDNGRIAFRVDRQRFALFDTVKVGTQVVTGPAANGNARLVDGVGQSYGLAAPDVLVVEERGPVRAVVRAEGDFAGPDGEKLFRWRARYFLYVGQPWVRLSWTIGNNRTDEVLTNLSSADVRIPFAPQGPVRGAFDGTPSVALQGESSTWLLQDKDDRFTASVNGAPSTGRQSLGCALLEDGKRGIAAVVKDFWQTYPKGLALAPDGLQIRVLPPLPADAYQQEAENSEDLIRLYYCYEKGQYRLKRGLEFTTDIVAFFVTAGDPFAEISLTTLQGWCNHPLLAVAPPDQYCSSGVFGFVEPRRAGLFEGYEQMAEKGFEQLEKNRRAKAEYGWMNYGDWHGERHFNWGNHEYDMMGALALQFARTGDAKWLWRADQAARHSTDIDTIHFPWQPRMPGRVYAHSVGHVGGFFDVNDPQFRRLGNVFGMSDLSRPNPFVAGVVDTGGHIFQPGNFLTGFLTGERRYREVAELVCEAQAAYFTSRFDFGIERAAGWPLSNAVSAYEATGNLFFLNAAHLYVERILAKQTERGDWGLPHGPPECLHQPPHPGGKAFAAGILLQGLMNFDAVAPSPAVKSCLVRNAHWLEQYAWNHETHGFRYIDTCPTFAKGGGNGTTDFVVSSGLAYACTLDADPALRALLLDSLSRAVRASAQAGKDFIMDICQTPHALALLHQRLGVERLDPRP